MEKRKKERVEKRRLDHLKQLEEEAERKRQEEKRKQEEEERKKREEEKAIEKFAQYVYFNDNILLLANLVINSISLFFVEQREKN